MNLFMKQKQTYTYQKKTCYQRENAGGRVNQEVGMNIHTTTIKEYEKE